MQVKEKLVDTFTVKLTRQTLKQLLTAFSTNDSANLYQCSQLYSSDRLPFKNNYLFSKDVLENLVSAFEALAGDDGYIFLSSTKFQHLVSDPNMVRQMSIGPISPISRTQ